MSQNCLLYGKTTAIVKPFCQLLLDSFHDLKLSILVGDHGVQVPLLIQFRKDMERRSALYANCIGIYAKGAVIRHVKFTMLVAVLSDTKQELAELDLAELMDNQAQHLLNDQAKIVVVGPTALSLGSMRYRGALLGKWFPNTSFVRYMGSVSRETALEVVKAIEP